MHTYTYTNLFKGSRCVFLFGDNEMEINLQLKADLKMLDRHDEAEFCFI